MKVVITMLIFLCAHSVAGQDGSFRFLKKNRKLNRQYETELNKGNGSRLFYAKPGITSGKSKKALLNVYPIDMKGDPRFLNPDIMDVEFDYRKFDMGNLIPNILRPVNGNP